MKKLSGSKFALFSVVLFACLAVALISYVQGGKPAPKEKWTVTLPSYSESIGTSNIYGGTYQTGEYVDAMHLASDLSHSFIFRVRKNPYNIFVGVQGIQTAPILNGLDTTLKYCFFPYGCDRNGSEPCIQCFLNQEHPGDYIHIQMSFGIGNINPLEMEIGSAVYVGHFSMDIWNSSTGFPDEWHSLITDWTNPAGTSGTMQFIRISPDTWQLQIVGAAFAAHESWLEAISSGRKGTKKAYNTNYVETLPPGASALMTWTRTIVQ
jgi:hypothetical protein